jgi:hypothetical protein
VVYLSGENQYEEIFDIAEAVVDKVKTLVVSISPVVKKELTSHLHSVESVREPIPRERKPKSVKL